MSSIQIGANDSPQLRALLRESLIHVDWINFSEEAAYERRLQSEFPKMKQLIHFLPRISASAFLEEWPFKAFNRMIEESSAPHVGIHLCASRSDFDRILQPETMIQELSKRLRSLKEVFQVPILVENMPSSCLPEGLKYMAEPSWINHLCQEADVGLLMDIAHARMSAEVQGSDIGSYLGKLPLERMEEIHISGIRKSAGKWMDAHESIDQVDLDILETLIGQKSPKIITVEYDHRGKHYDSNQIKIRLFNALYEVEQVIEKIKMPSVLIR